MAVYLNTYRMSREYGGPEEGGWWYDAGDPVQSILLSHDDYEEWMEKTPGEEKERLRNGATFAFTRGEPPTPVKNGYGGYVFATGSHEPICYRRDNDFRSLIEDDYAQPFPTERPTYE